jgi:hypothetical protein
MSLIIADTGLRLGEGLTFLEGLGGAGLDIVVEQSQAQALLNGQEGLAIVFTDPYFLTTTGFMGSAYISGT